MASVTKFPTTARAVSYPGSTWTNVGNVLTSNSSTASSYSGSIGQYTDYINCGGFGFSIPDGSTIDGLVITVRGLTDQASTTNLAYAGFIDTSNDSLISNTNGGGSYWGGSMADHSLGTATDKWAPATWSTSVINSANFGASIRLYNNQGYTTSQIDSISVTVYYTPPPEPSVSPATNFPTAYNAINVQYSSNIHLSPAQNLYVTDGSVATAYNTLTDWDIYSGFGLNIPSTATIDGLVVTIKAYQSLQSGSMSFNNVQLYDMSTSTAFGADRSTGAAVPSSLSDCVFGSATDKWATTLTPAVLNAATFGVGIRVTTGSFAQANVDSLKITVYFTTAGGVASTRQMFLIF